MKFGWIGGVALGALAVAASPSWAGATIHIGGGTGSGCETGGCPIYGSEVNNFDLGLDLYQNSGGAPDLLSPVLLILAVPNDTATGTLTGAGAGTIMNANLISPYPGGTPVPLSVVFGTSSFGLSGSGFNGLMTSGDVYSFLGLSGDASNSMTNFKAADLAVDGIAATNFGIYVYGFDTAAFGGQDLIDLTLTGVPEGTFAVGFGEDSKGKIYDTPFTESGNHDAPPSSVPEPLTIALFGAGFAGLTSLRKRRKS